MKYALLVLKMGVIAHDLQGHLGYFDSKLLEIRLVCTIVFNGFELESPNMHPRTLSAGRENGCH